MKFFYRKVECSFREFISTYLASTMGYASTEQALSLAHALLTQKLIGQTISDEQRAQIVRDTGGQCMIECESVDEFMNIPVSAVNLSERGPKRGSKPAFEVPIRAEYGNVHSKGGMCILVGADHETIGELHSATEAEVQLLVERVNRKMP